MIALRGHDPREDFEDDPSEKSVPGDLEHAFTGLRRIVALTNQIDARTDFATDALTDMDDDEVGETIEHGDEDYEVPALRHGARGKNRRR